MAEELGFLEDEPTPADEVVQPVEPEVNTSVEPEGKGEPTAAPPAAAQEEPKFAPITALLDERDKRQAAQRENEDLRKQLAAFHAQQQRRQPPSFDENPEQRLEYEQAQIQNSLWNERLNMSEQMAVGQFGGDAVDAAKQAFATAAQNNPALVMEIRRQANPYGFVMQWHQREKMLSDIGTDPEAYRQRIISEYMATLAPPPVQAPPAKPLPPAAAKAPSAGGQANPKGTAFDEMMG